jgi:cytochrome c oxidase subunit 1
MRRGPAAETNPWECSTLEWTPASYATNERLSEWRPWVNHGPYEYNVPGAAETFIPQHMPDAGEPEPRGGLLPVTAVAMREN